MSEPVTIKITWMDRDEPFMITGWCDTSLSEGVLHVYQYTGVTGTLIRERHYPLANIRHYDKAKR